MPIDASIPLQVKNPEFQSPLQMYAQAAQVRQLQNEALAQQRAAQEDQYMRQAFQQNMKPDQNGNMAVNQQGVLNTLYKGGKVSPLKVMSLQEHLQGLDEKAQLAKINQLKARNEMANQLLQPLTDPSQYPAARQKAIEMGIESAKNWPLQLTVDGLKAFKLGALDGKTQLEQANKEIEHALTRQDLALKKLDIEGKNDKAKREAKSSESEFAMKLRKERSQLPTTKATQEVSAAYNKVQAASKSPTAAGDLSMIFNYMKMLDPGSVVREGEFANAQNAAGVPDRITNAYNNILRGERLNPNQRKDFLNQARGIYASQMDVQKKVDKGFIDLSNKYGIDPKDVLLNFEANSSGEKDLNNMSDDEIDAMYKQMGGK